MDDDEFSKTLADIGQRLEHEGKQVTVGAYRASALLRELNVELVPTLEEGGVATSGSGEGGEIEPGRTAIMGRFRLEREIGRGGMGRVYEAYDPELRRPVAVKCFLDPRVVTAQQLGRFVAEAQITAQLEHPNIVPVYDMGVTLEGQLYFVMRRVNGRSLSEVIKSLIEGDVQAHRDWTRHRLLGAFVQACHAVAYAHDRGVVHRDLKPANIMVGDFGEVLVMDWGIAKVIEALQANPVDRVKVMRTEWGRPLGTRGYMSPEQLLGQHEAVDPRSDVWSLGAILYELLTLQRAFQGIEEQITQQVLTGQVVDPRERAPHQCVPDELAGVVLQALAAGPEDRFPTAAELARAVEDYLEGSQRRAAADGHTTDAAALFREYEALDQEKLHLTQLERQLEGRIAPWAPLEEKAEILSIKERIEEVENQRAEIFAQVVRSCERALEQDPGNVHGRSLLAQVYATKLVEAEARRDQASQRFFESRVRAYDNGTLTSFLSGTGSLTLHTDPPGAVVICQRYEQHGLVWGLGDEKVLGRTPLSGVPIAMGSYRLVLQAPGKRDTVYPVNITRGRAWSSGSRPIRLFSDEEIGSGFVYVPAGSSLVGGDAGATASLYRGEIWVPSFFISVLPVTMGEYVAFINAVHAFDPEAAWARVPRAAATPVTSSGQYWPRPAAGEPYAVPDVDDDGDRWDPRWPAAAVSWHDAIAYAEWLSAQRRTRLHLTPELWWEKAARGVDGRHFPWGDDFDPSLCKMRQSRPGRPLPESVGTFETDLSVYGVRDLSGTVTEWAADASYDGIPELRAARGGSWADHPTACRLAQRHSFESWSVRFQVGFRLARPCPGG
jgi:eukaryotic-like serine/threonine-protein kinase